MWKIFAFGGAFGAYGSRDVACHHRRVTGPAGKLARFGNGCDWAGTGGAGSDDSGHAGDQAA